MFKFKLQDNQREEHYIPHWNFMPKTKKMMTSCFSGWNCLMFWIIAGNRLIELNFFLDFYPMLDRDLLHKNGNELITD